MKFIPHTDPNQFAHDVARVVGGRRVENNVIIGRARSFCQSGLGTSRAYSVCHEGQPILAACMTPGALPLLFSEGPVEAAMFLLRHIAAHDMKPNGLSAPATMSDAIATIVESEFSWTIHRRRQVTLHRLGALTVPAEIGGTLRPVTAADEDWFCDRFRQFCHDVRDPLPESHQRAVARLKISAGDAWTWDHQDIFRSVAATTYVAPDLIRISLVHTPPEWRGRGYARAIVAALCQRLREADTRRDILLYADDGNPVATNLYRRLGFVPLASHADLSLTE